MPRITSHGVVESPRTRTRERARVLKFPAPQDGDMVWVPGRTFMMGSDHHYPEERPAHTVRVDGFWMDRIPVTNAHFARFVKATKYKTVAEIIPSPADYPGALPEMLRAGSLVFMKPGRRPPEFNVAFWWQYVFGANWRHPQGPGSALEGLALHPVVHIAYADAEAYAQWAGKSIPTEAEWEMACRGGLEEKTYAWGNDLMPDGVPLANYWQGSFPHENVLLDGWEGTSPVGVYPANPFGLFDMIGNVWEWTADWFTASHEVTKSCCMPSNPRGGAEGTSYDPDPTAIRIPRKVLKGGSHLCAPNYCRRYRPAARHPQAVDTSTSHIGFRCVVRR